MAKDDSKHQACIRLVGVISRDARKKSKTVECDKMSSNCFKKYSCYSFFNGYAWCCIASDRIFMQESFWLAVSFGNSVAFS